MSHLLQDIKFGLRLLWKQKVFALAATLTLAACIGANAAIFASSTPCCCGRCRFRSRTGWSALYNSYPGRRRARQQRRAGLLRPLRETDAFEEQALYHERGVTAVRRAVAATTGQPGHARAAARCSRRSHFRGRLSPRPTGEVGRTGKSSLAITSGSHSAVGTTPLAGAPGQRRAAHRGRRAAARVLFLTPRRTLGAGGVHGQTTRRAPHSNNWPMVGAAQAGPHRRPGAAADDALNARNMERFPQFKEILPTPASTRRPHAGGPLRDVSSSCICCGAACVRAADRLRQHHEPGAGAIERANGGDGHAHALGAGAAAWRDSCSPRPRVLTVAGGAFGLASAYWALRLLLPGSLEAAARGEIGLDTGGRLSPLAWRWWSALVGLVPILWVRRMNLNQAFREEGRGGTAGAAPVSCAAGWWRARWHSRSCCGRRRPAARQLPARARGRPRLRRRSSSRAVTCPPARYKDRGAARAHTARRSIACARSRGRAAGITSTIRSAAHNSDSVILAEGTR